MKRVVIISDLHCGHKYGITPPQWQTLNLQKKFWTWLTERIKTVGKVDALICNGDAIDGAGERNGGIELITTDRLVQGEMAYEVIREFNATRNYIVAGTPYHTGDKEDFEKVLADRLDAEFHNSLTLDVKGFIFNCVHKTGSSGVPQGRGTALLKAQMWNVLNSLDDGIKADAIIRSHVHYHILVENRWGITLTTPCLQINSNYGQKMCDGYTDLGFLVFEIENKAEWQLKKYLLKEKIKPAEISKL